MAASNKNFELLMAVGFSGQGFDKLHNNVVSSSGVVQLVSSEATLSFSQIALIIITSL